MIVEPKRERLLRSGEAVHLEPKVMQVLLVLAAHADKPVSRELLLETVLAGTVVGDEVLSRAISLLRSALGDDRTDPKFIRTPPRQGYELIVPAEPIQSTQSKVGMLVAAGVLLAIVVGWWWVQAPASDPVLVLMPIEPANELLGGAATGINDDLYALINGARDLQPLAKRWSFGLRDCCR